MHDELKGPMAPSLQRQGAGVVQQCCVRVPVVLRLCRAAGAVEGHPVVRTARHGQGEGGLSGVLSVLKGVVRIGLCR